MILRTINEEDLLDIYQLTKKAGLSCDIDKEKWVLLKKWASFSNPFKEDFLPHGYVAEKDNTIIGHIVFSYRPLKVGDEVVIGVVLTDYVVDPASRGVAGLLLCKKTIDFFRDKGKAFKLIGFHYSESGGQIWKAFGASEIQLSNITFQKKISQVNYILKKILQRKYWPPFVESCWQDLCLLKEGVRCGENGSGLFVNREFVLSPANRDRIDSLCERFAGTYSLGVQRNFRYLKWRYADHPLSKYYYVALENGTDICGICIFDMNIYGDANICEFIFDPKVGRIEKCLLHSMLREAKVKGAIFLKSKSIKSSLIGMFSEMKFSKLEKKYNQFLVCPADECCGEAVFTYGDFKEF